MADAGSSSDAAAGRKRARAGDDTSSNEQTTAGKAAPVEIIAADEDDEDDDEATGAAASDDDDGDSESEASGAEEVTALEDDEAAALAADLGDDAREGKRRRGETADTQPMTAGLADKGVSETSMSTYASLKEDSSVTQDAAAASGTAEPTEEMIRVVKTFRFGREDVTEEKLLPASHPDAKAHLAKQAKEKGQEVSNASASTTTHASSIPAASAASLSAASRPLPPGPRRKKGGGLAAMSAAVTAKPGKINTLEKSKMDWTRFKDADLDEHARHELDAQTKGGSSGLSSVKGYMDRRDFLDRVQGRLGSDGKP